MRLQGRRIERPRSHSANYGANYFRWETLKRRTRCGARRFAAAVIGGDWATRPSVQKARPPRPVSVRLASRWPAIGSGRRGSRHSVAVARGRLPSRRQNWDGDAWRNLDFENRYDVNCRTRHDHSRDPWHFAFRQGMHRAHRWWSRPSHIEERQRRTRLLQVLRVLSQAASRNELYHWVATGEKRPLAQSHHADRPAAGRREGFTSARKHFWHRRLDSRHLRVALHESLYCLMYYNVGDRVAVGETHDCCCRLTSSA